MIHYALTALCFSIAALVGCGTGSSSEDAAIGVVQSWEHAIRNGDIKGAKECFTQDAGLVPEYVGGSEALEFWKYQITNDLEKAGFEGKWTSRKGTWESREVIYVFPVLSKGPHREAVWVVQEDKRWKIATLFVTPPEE